MWLVRLAVVDENVKHLVQCLVDVFRNATLGILAQLIQTIYLCSGHDCIGAGGRWVDLPDLVPVVRKGFSGGGARDE